VQQLESSKLKLASLEQELQKARQQVYVYFVDVEIGYLDTCFIFLTCFWQKPLILLPGFCIAGNFHFQLWRSNSYYEWKW
jgi:hypothetical protein